MRFLVDEDFNNRIVRGLLRRQPDLDIVRVQDIGLSGTADPELLEWANSNKRILLTHDVSTMTGFAYQRMRDGNSIAGIVEVPQSLPVGQAIEDLLVVVKCSSIEEWNNQILYLPL